MVDQSFAHHRDGFKAAVRVAGKTGHGVAVVHAPAAQVAEVLAHVAVRQRHTGAHVGVADWVGVVVVNAKQKGVHRGPGDAQGLELNDGGAKGGHGFSLG